jgi:hypothetical protein
MGEILSMNNAIDPARFRSSLIVPSANGPRPLGECIADFQERDFAILDGSFQALADGRKPDPSRIWLERTKGASKSSDLAAMLLWLLAFSRRPIFGQVGAADADQADELRKAARGILRLNRWLQSAVQIQSTAIINPATESRVEIIPADAAGSHGARPDLVILDELVHIRDREFAETLLDNASKMPNGLVVIATNAGHIGSWQASWRANAVESDRWKFSAFTEPAPWLDPAEIEEARKRNSANRFARLWRGEWVSDSESAFEPELIEQAVSLPGPVADPEPGWSYVCAVDIGLTRDATAVAVLGKHVGQTIRKPVERPVPRSVAVRAMLDLGYLEPSSKPEFEIEHIEGTGRLKLVHLRLWKPVNGGKVDLENVESTIIDLHSRFRFQRLVSDPWQAEQMIQRMSRRMQVSSVPFTGPNLQAMASGMLDVFREGVIDLFPDDDLVADLRELRISERSYGFRLESPRGDRGHGDSATALTLAVHASRLLRSGENKLAGRKLVLYP